MVEFLAPYLETLITGVIALVLGWLGKSKIQKKADNADLTAKIQAVYKEWVSDADARIDFLKDEIRLMKEQRALSEDKFKIQLQEIEKSWQTKYTRLQTKYSALLRDFQNYKAKHQ